MVVWQPYRLFPIVNTRVWSLVSSIQFSQSQSQWASAAQIFPIIPSSLTIAHKRARWTFTTCARTQTHTHTRRRRKRNQSEEKSARTLVGRMRVTLTPSCFLYVGLGVEEWWMCEMVSRLDCIELHWWHCNKLETLFEVSGIALCVLCGSIYSILNICDRGMTLRHWVFKHLVALKSMFSLSNCLQHI